MSHDFDFLSKNTLPNERVKENRRRFLIRCLIGAVVVFGFLTVWTAANAGLATAALFDGRDQLFAAKTAVENFSFDEAEVTIKAAEENFSRAARSFKRIAWLKIIPWLGPQVSAAEILLDASVDLFEAIEPLADLGSEIVRLSGLVEESGGELSQTISFSYSQMTPAAKRLVLQRLNGAAPDLVLLSERAKIIKEKFSDLQSVPEPMGTVVRKLDQELSLAVDFLELAATSARLLPFFAGLDGEQKFLILLENNTELRPAGGFIGAYGVLRVLDGEIIELDLNDSYLLDRAAALSGWQAQPPEPLRRYLPIDQWFFRDSNWSPDFSVSARHAISVFTGEVLSLPEEWRANLQTPVSFNGVIALTPDFVADLLAVTGSITVGGETFTSENITEALEYQVEVAYREKDIPYEQRKEIISELLEELTSRLFTMSFSEWDSVATALKNNLTRKQIVFFSNASIEAEEIIKEAGWGGLVEAGTGDFLMVVDANMSSLKSDPMVSRNITYKITPDNNGRFISKVSIKYNHQGDFDWKTTRYRTYTRAYVPLGSEFIRGKGMLSDDKIKNPSGLVGSVDITQELGLTVFGAFISIEPGKEGELSFEYYLPDSVATMITSGDYLLKVEKQIGAAEHGLTLDLDFGKKLKSADPAELPIYWGDSLYSGSFGLEKDLIFTLCL